MLTAPEFNSDNLFFTMKKSNYVSEKIIGKKGSLAIFNTRCLHKASILKKDSTIKKILLILAV